MPRSFFSFLLVTLISYPVLGQDQNVAFNQVTNINGNMQLNRFIMPDGSRIETFSQTQEQLLVDQNPNPLSANHVVGSTGQPFVQLSQNSMTISTNGASNLVGGQIEMAIPQATLDQMSVSADNTFVAKLSPNRQAWMVMETVKAVNTTDSTVRMVKLNTIDGEYMAVGRQTTETSVVLSPFGNQNNVNITGSGIQEIEFQDGFRMSIRASKPMTLNTDVVNGVSTAMLTGTDMSVNNYRYLVTTNLATVSPNLNQMMAVIQLPLNAQRVMAMATKMGAGMNDTVNLGISQRGVIQNPGGAQGNLQPQKRQRASAANASVKSSKTTGAVSKASAASEASATDAAAPTEAAASTDAATASNDTAAASAPADSASAASDVSSSTSEAVSAASDPATTAASQPGTGTTNNNPAATQLLLSPTFTPIQANTVLDMETGRIAVTTLQLDGEFIVTMGMAGTGKAAVNPAEIAPPGGATPSSTPSLGSTPAKRQAGGSTSVQISMVELNNMVVAQKNGGMLPVWAMMDEFAAQNAPAAAAPAPNPLGLKRRSPSFRNRRFVGL